jgi:hypothetical protein
MLRTETAVSFCRLTIALFWPSAVKPSMTTWSAFQTLKAYVWAPASTEWPVPGLPPPTSTYSRLATES